MTDARFIHSAWQRVSPFPGGKWLFSLAAGLKGPYVGTIHPQFTELRPGYCEVRIKRRRGLLNGFGTIHLAAQCNLAELVAATMLEATLPPTHRYMPKSMTMQFLKKATTDLRAVSQLEPIPSFGEALDLALPVDVQDAEDHVVSRHVVTMRVSPSKR